MSNDMSAANPVEVTRVRQAMGLNEPLPVHMRSGSAMRYRATSVFR